MRGQNDYASYEQQKNKLRSRWPVPFQNARKQRRTFAWRGLQMRVRDLRWWLPKRLSKSRIASIAADTMTTIVEGQRSGRLTGQKLQVVAPSWIRAASMHSTGILRRPREKDEKAKSGRPPKDRTHQCEVHDVRNTKPVLSESAKTNCLEYHGKKTVGRLVQPSPDSRNSDCWEGKG